MQAGSLTRRAALLLPVFLAACGGQTERTYEPLRYNYLPPIELRVDAIEVQQRFIPAGVPPDVSTQDPAQPIEALTAMANDRLQAFGTSNKAVFAILDAALTRENDVVTGSFTVSLTIQDDTGNQLGFARARVDGRHVGRIDDLRAVLYDLTKSMMADMNVEFEYQIRRNLRAYLTDTTAPDTPVEQAPLDQSGAGGTGVPPGQLPPLDQPGLGGTASPLPTQLPPPDQPPGYAPPAGQLQPGQVLPEQPTQ